jgi:NADP-dependent 3-hydroxy acid dehydrogenase YdfG
VGADPVKTFDGQVVAITGAGSGIGRALALDLARRGALLALSDVDEAGLARTVDVVKAAGVREVRGQVVDVASRAALEVWVTDLVGQLGRVNVLVNNAGVAVTGDFGDLAHDDMEWIVGVNFWGVVHGTQAFLPHLVASGDGHIVVMSSLFGLMSVPGQSMYIATKFAVRGLAEAIREELLVSGAPVGLTVVHPGGVMTNIVRNARVSTHEDAEETRRLFEERLARTSPAKAADVILRGVLKGKPRVLVGADARLLHHLTRLSGARYQDVVARLSVRARRRANSP